jgi:sugar diacid utilization regulator
VLALRQGDLVPGAAASAGRAAGLLAARERVLRDHGADLRFGVSVPSIGFPSVQRAYREASLALSYTSAARPVVSLSDLSSLECALVGADAATRAIIAAKGADLRALAPEELAGTERTVRAFAAANLNIGAAACALDVHPNTVRHRLNRIAQRTGHDPWTFAGLVELTCVLELLDAEVGR